MAYDAENFVVSEPLSVPTVSQHHRVRALRNRILFFNEFNMHEPQKHECGTPACFYGHVQAMIGHHVNTRTASDFLGLTPEQGYCLFGCQVEGALFAPGKYHRNWEATPKQAAALLDHYLATSEVDWSVA